MTGPSADLLLHPVRLRIVQALIDQAMTATEIKAHLGDVAPATLYRHLNQLEAAGLIEIVGERRVRGGVERSYRVVERAVSLGGDDLDGVGADDHFRYFVTFVATLLADYATYLRDGPPDLEADRVGYRQVPLWLSDDELDQLVEELRTVVRRRAGNESRPGRRRRLLTTIIMPDDRSG